MSSFRFTPLALNAIRRHAQQRKNAATIAKLMNCAEGTVENICRDHGIELVTMDDGAPPLSPYRSATGRNLFVPIDIKVGIEALDLLRLEAARRGVQPATLIARLAEVIATEQLYAAVLDK